MFRVLCSQETLTGGCTISSMILCSTPLLVSLSGKYLNKVCIFESPMYGYMVEAFFCSFFDSGTVK